MKKKTIKWRDGAGWLEHELRASFDEETGTLTLSDYVKRIASGEYMEKKRLERQATIDVPEEQLIELITWLVERSPTKFQIGRFM